MTCLRNRAGRVTKKKLYFNGNYICDVEATGDPALDADFVQQQLRARGLARQGEINTTKAMFNHAAAFAKTAERIYNGDLVSVPRPAVSLVPFIINSVFAIEIYLKTLGAHFKQPQPGHDLLKLFDSLPAEAHQALKDHFSCAKSLSEISKISEYRSAIEKMRGAFVEWRYLYERNEPTSIEIRPMIFVIEVAHETCRSLLSRV